MKKFMIIGLIALTSCTEEVQVNDNNNKVVDNRITTDTFVVEKYPKIGKDILIYDDGVNDTVKAGIKQTCEWYKISENSYVVSTEVWVGNINRSETLEYWEVDKVSKEDIYKVANSRFKEAVKLRDKINKNLGVIK